MQKFRKRRINQVIGLNIEDDNKINKKSKIIEQCGSNFIAFTKKDMPDCFDDEKWGPKRVDINQSIDSQLCSLLINISIVFLSKINII